ncbi:hypothetical protein SALBM217S_10421 [Streptomyces griseoloalbus]
MLRRSRRVSSPCVGSPRASTRGAGRKQFLDRRRLDGTGEVLDAGFHAFNGIVELSVEGSGALSRYMVRDRESKPSNGWQAEAGGPGASARSVHPGGEELRRGRHPPDSRANVLRLPRLVPPPLHERALAAFLALVPGHGHATATAVMQAVSRDAVDEAFQLVDESHARLLHDRRTLRAVEDALRGLTAESAGTDAAGFRPMFIGPLAEELGVRPATLRKWEAAGLVRPRRDPVTGYRVYEPSDVRDAHLVHQLRRGGYLLERIAPLITQVRDEPAASNPSRALYGTGVAGCPTVAGRCCAGPPRWTRIWWSWAEFRLSPSLPGRPAASAGRRAVRVPSSAMCACRRRRSGW